MSDSMTTTDAILEQTEWVRRLALQMVRDPNAADDLAQSTCVAALESPPPPGANLRAWLTRVLRNLWLHDRRTTVRRVERERRAARPEFEGSVVDLIARAQQQQGIVAEVLRLPQRYRAVVLMRYFEGLPPRKIAARAGIPVGTVKTRLHRAQRILRERIDAREGRTGAWLAALLPLTSGGAFRLVSTAAVSMKTKHVLLSIVAIPFVALGGWSLWSGDGAEGARQAGPSAAAQASPREVVAQEREVSAHRTTVPVDTPSIDVPLDATDAFVGVVLDAEARPLSGMEVRVGDASAVSGEDGRFSAPTPRRTTSVVVAGANWITVLEGVVGPASRIEPVVVAAAQLELRVEVVDERGAPLDGVDVRIALPSDFGTRFDRVLDRSEGVPWGGRSGSDGHTRPLSVGRVRGAEIVVRHSGFLPARAPLPKSGGVQRITLRRPSIVDGSLQGRVTDPAGQPVADARVALCDSEAVCDEHGRFAVLVAEIGTNRNLVAMQRGYQPASVRVADDIIERAQRSESTFVHLQLGAAPRRISGTVVDASGEPREGLMVWTARSMTFGNMGGRLAAVEAWLADGDDRSWNRTDTNVFGEFALEGLLDRPYELVVLDPSTLRRTTLGPFAAGTEGLVLTAPSDGVHARVAGQVVTPDGTPQAAVIVTAFCDAHRLPHEAGGYATKGLRAGSVRTDGDGRFEFANLASEHVYLRVDGDSIVHRSFGRDDPNGFAAVLPGAPENLRLVVEPRVHLRVELDDAARADGVGIENAAGEAMILDLIRGNSMTSMHRFPLHEGRSETFTTTMQAVTLVLYRGEEAIERVPIRLRVGEETVVR